MAGRLRPLTVLATAAVVAAVLVPLAHRADAATDRCIDVEIVSPQVDAIFEDLPLFDRAETPTIELRFQLTDGNGDAFDAADDELGTFDCPGNPVAGTLSLDVYGDGAAGDLLAPGTPVAVGASGMSAPVPVTNDEPDEVARDQYVAYATVPSPMGGSSAGREELYWGDRGFPSNLSCDPQRHTLKVGETRSFLVTTADSWADPVAGVPVDLERTGDHAGPNLFDDALTDADGQLTTQYSENTVGDDFNACFVDADLDDTADHDVGYGSVSGSSAWLAAADVTNSDVEVDAHNGGFPQPLGVPQDGCDASQFTYLNDGNNGLPLDMHGNSTDDEFEASRGTLPLNSVVRVCLAGRTVSALERPLYGREATMTLTSSGVRLLTEDFATIRGGSRTIAVDPDGWANFYVHVVRPGVKTMFGSVDGVADSDGISLSVNSPTPNDARILSCEGGGWITLPADTTIECTVTDGIGNPVPGVAVDWDFADVDGASSSVASDVLTDGSGAAAATFDSPTEGRTDVTVSVSVGDCNPPAPADGPGTYDVGKPAAVCDAAVPIRWSDDGPPTNVDVDPGANGSSDAGDTQVVEVTVTDPADQPVDSVDVCVVVTGANPGTYTGVTDDDGMVAIDVPAPLPGNDLVEVIVDMDGDGTCDETAVLSEAVQRNGVIRFAGDDRRLTAVLASQERFADHGAGGAIRAAGAAPQDQVAGAVVIARQDLFADALAGTPLAAANDAPLLLTPTAELHADTMAEVDRVLADGGTVYLLGGEAALSSAVADALADRWSVERLGGDTRFDTAVLIAQATTTDPTTVLVTTGTDFADALTAGAAAAASDGVVVLSGDSVPVDTTTDYLEATDALRVAAIGGPASRAYPDLNAIVGDDRFATGLAVAEAFFVDPEVVGIARGYAFPDGLSGGAHIGNLGGPLLLVRGIAEVDGLTHPDNAGVAEYLADHADTLYAAYVYGGAAAVAEVFTGQLLDAIS